MRRSMWLALMLLSAIWGVSNGGYPIYWINLDSRTDRRATMQAMLASEQQVRIPAVTADDVQRMLNERTLSVDAAVVRTFDSWDRFRELRNTTVTFVEVACTLSHVFALQHAFRNGDEVAVVLEDDLELSRTGIEERNGLTASWRRARCMLSELVSNAPEDWEVIALPLHPLPPFARCPLAFFYTTPLAAYHPSQRRPGALPSCTLCRFCSCLPITSSSSEGHWTWMTSCTIGPCGTGDTGLYHQP